MQIDTSTFEVLQERETNEANISQVKDRKKEKEKKKVQKEENINPGELWSFGVKQISDRNLDELFDI